MNHKWMSTLCAIGILGSLLGLWNSWVWLDERRATKYISGLDIPDAAVVEKSFGTRNEPVFVWKMEPGVLRSIEPSPTGTAWLPFDGRGFGSLEMEQISTQTEVNYYTTSFWSVAVYRDLNQGRLTVAGIYTN